jgi:hypothetical protein
MVIAILFGAGRPSAINCVPGSSGNRIVAIPKTEWLQPSAAALRSTAAVSKSGVFFEGKDIDKEL